MSLISRFLRENMLFNANCERVSMFTIEEGEHIETGSPVVVNTKTLLARNPVKSSGFFAVGKAKKVIDLKNGNQAVICTDGYHMFYDPDRNISDNDIGKACYFDGDGGVTMENINRTRAGIVEIIDDSDDPIDIEDGADRLVYVRIDLCDGGDLEW